MPASAGTDRRWHCPAPNCEKTYSKEYDLREHVDTHNGVFVECPVDGCDKKSPAYQTMVKHVRQKHGDWADGDEWTEWRKTMRRRGRDRQEGDDEEEDDEQQDEEDEGEDDLIYGTPGGQDDELGHEDDLDDDYGV
jgi:hypothetical protein